jgi:TatD DNase family protein
MILTDTHTHLYSDEFDSDRDEMIQRAISNGVTRFFVPAIDSTCTQSMYDLEEKLSTKYFFDDRFASLLCQRKLC